MFQPADYVKEIQKFTTSQYWNSGVRITAGVMVPMLVLAYYDQLSLGIAFLLASLFVGITDSPGPIHHRRNGMIAAVILNTLTVGLTILIRAYPILILLEVITLSFLYSFISIYGARAAAVGTLALVMMMLNISPDYSISAVDTVLLTFAGGCWYTIFSLFLNRLQPYKLVEQALGEYLLTMSSYLHARAALFKDGNDFDEKYRRIMSSQVAVMHMQNDVRDLLFKTRQFVGDPSPKSRSLMMIYLESTELFEETMHSYQDYKTLHENFGDSKLLRLLYKLILQVVAELEYTGLSIQTGKSVRKEIDLQKQFNEVKSHVEGERKNVKDTHQEQLLDALQQTINNLSSILSRVAKIGLYSRMELGAGNIRMESNQYEQPQLRWIDLLKENFSFKSIAFRFSLRITIALTIGYFISMAFAQSHSYWVMLTIVTILKPVYYLARKRNFERVTGTLSGVALASFILWFTDNNTVLFLLMIVSMLLAYSFLRVYYLAFVTFLTIYLIITFHFLEPSSFRQLIGERLIDTVIGAIISAVASRFIFPVWQSENIKPAIEQTLLANIQYFHHSIDFIFRPDANKNIHNKARREAIVSLTNISDLFQKMISEPVAPRSTSLMHQLVIANHTLTNRIAALSSASLKNIPVSFSSLKEHINHLLDPEILSPQQTSSVKPNISSELPPLHPVALVLSAASEVRAIIMRLKNENPDLSFVKN